MDAVPRQRRDDAALGGSNRDQEVAPGLSPGGAEPGAVPEHVARLVEGGAEGQRRDAPVDDRDWPVEREHDRGALLDGTFVREQVGAVKTETRSEEHTSELQSRENLVCRL